MADNHTHTQAYQKAQRAKYLFRSAVIGASMLGLGAVGTGGYWAITYESPMTQAVRMNDLDAVKSVVETQHGDQETIEHGFDRAMDYERYDLAGQIAESYQLDGDFLQDQLNRAIEKSYEDRVKMMLEAFDFTAEQLEEAFILAAKEDEAEMLAYIEAAFDGDLSQDVYAQAVYESLSRGYKRESADALFKKLDGFVPLYNVISEQAVKGTFDGDVVPFLERHQLYGAFIQHSIEQSDNVLFDKLWRDGNVSWDELSVALTRIIGEGEGMRVNDLAKLTGLANRAQYPAYQENGQRIYASQYVADLLFPPKGENQDIAHPLHQEFLASLQNDDVQRFLYVIGEGDVSNEKVIAAFERAIEQGNTGAAEIFVHYFGLGQDTLLKGMETAISNGEGAVASVIAGVESVTDEIIVQAVKDALEAGNRRQAITAVGQMALSKDAKNDIRALFTGSILPVLEKAWDAQP